MSLATLRTRLRRLEAKTSRADVPLLSAIIREARELIDSESAEEAAARSLREVDEAIDVLLHGPLPLSRAAARWFPFLNDLRAQRARQHLRDMQEGGAPAGDYLATIEQARGLYAPRHWPLPAALREVRQ